MLCIRSALVGFLLILGPKTFLFDAYNRTIAAAFYSVVPMTLEAREHDAWLLATVGAGTLAVPDSAHSFATPRKVDTRLSVHRRSDYS